MKVLLSCAVILRIWLKLVFVSLFSWANIPKIVEGLETNLESISIKKIKFPREIGFKTLGKNLVPNSYSPSDHFNLALHAIIYFEDSEIFAKWFGVSSILS